MKAKKVDTESIIQSATQKITSDIVSLTERKGSAINIFRKTADELQMVNEELSASLDRLSSLKDFIDTQATVAEQMMTENANVRSRILEIIGG